MGRRRKAPQRLGGFTLLVVTCEHASNAVPRGASVLLKGAGSLLSTHRGWDRGTPPLARAMARRFNAPLFMGAATRLLIDLNRSLERGRAFSEFTRGLDPLARALLADRHWTPHRDAVTEEIGREVDAGGRVLHIGVHSFTPVLRGVRRNADVGLLYDPRRALEKSLCAAWLAALATAAPGLRCRKNYPYLGTSDGFTTTLRKRFPPDHYAGIELEVNQRLLRGGDTLDAALTRNLLGSLAQALRDEAQEVQGGPRPGR